MIIEYIMDIEYNSKALRTATSWPAISLPRHTTAVMLNVVLYTPVARRLVVVQYY